MAARCLPIVVDPPMLEKTIHDIFSSLSLSAQNELHGYLMGLKRLGEFSMHRIFKGAVFGLAFLS